jgi:hypothetical protein
LFNEYIGIRIRTILYSTKKGSEIDLLININEFPFYKLKKGLFLIERGKHWF